MKPVLTKQQQDVLRLLAEGKNAKEIAMQMKLSPKTIEGHRLNIKQRLGIGSLALLVQYALKNRIARFVLLAAAASILVAFTGAPLRTSVQFAWQYPTNQLSTNLTFRLYASPDAAAPATNWLVVTNVVGTNLGVTLPLAPTNLFFFVTASNLWGESNPSQVVSTPAPPRNDLAPSIQ